MDTHSIDHLILPKCVDARQSIYIEPFEPAEHCFAVYLNGKVFYVNANRAEEAKEKFLRMCDDSKTEFCKEFHDHLMGCPSMFFIDASFPRINVKVAKVPLSVSADEDSTFSEVVFNGVVAIKDLQSFHWCDFKGVEFPNTDHVRVTSRLFCNPLGENQYYYIGEFSSINGAPITDWYFYWWLTTLVF